MLFRSDLRWHAQGAPREAFTESLQLLDASGRLVAQQDQEPLKGDFPTSSWRQGDVIDETVQLQVSTDRASGEYRLALVLYQTLSGQRLATASGDFADLGTVTLPRVP